jgi:hypothetical protein
MQEVANVLDCRCHTLEHTDPFIWDVICRENLRPVDAYFMVEQAHLPARLREEVRSLYERISVHG